MEVGQNWNLFKIIWFLHHLKALNDTNSEWAHFKNLAKGFQRYLHFSAQKMGFLRQGLRGNLHTWDGTKKIFCNFLGINTPNFVKNDPDFENKGLFDAKFHGNWHEKIFRSQSSDIWGLGPKN